MPVYGKHVLVLHGPVRHVWCEVFSGLDEAGWWVHNCDSDLLLVSQLGQITDVGSRTRFAISRSKSASQRAQMKEMIITNVPLP